MGGGGEVKWCENQVGKCEDGPDAAEKEEVGCRWSPARI